MKSFIFIIAVVFCLTGSVLYGAKPAPESEWPRHVIRFSPEVTLGDVFASGLRPYRFPGLETNFLETKHAMVKVAAKPVDLPEVACERVEITVKEPWLLSYTILRTPPISVERARTETLKWLPFSSKTTEELDDFLAAVAADWLHYDFLPGGGNREFSFMWKLEDGRGPRVQVFLMKAYNPETPLRFCVSFDTDHLRSFRSRRSFYKTPVPPPPGYEDALMDAPKDFGPDSPNSWMIPEKKGTVGEMVSDEMKSHQDPANGSLKHNPPRSGSNGESPAPAVLWWIVIFILAAGGAVYWRFNTIRQQG